MILTLLCDFVIGFDAVGVLYFAHRMRPVQGGHPRRLYALSCVGFCVTVILFGLLMRFAP